MDTKVGKGGLPREAPTLKAAWPFHYVLKVMPRNNLKTLISSFLSLTATEGGGSSRKCLSSHQIIVTYFIRCFIYVTTE